MLQVGCICSSSTFSQLLFQDSLCTQTKTFLYQNPLYHFFMIQNFLKWLVRVVEVDIAK